MRKTLLIVVWLLTSLSGVDALAQQRMISGTVSSQDDGLGLPGVNVLIKETSRGVVTDLDGRYSISANVGETLVFSFVGYLSQELEVGQSTVLDVALATDAKVLGEVLVVGYGSTTKGDLTGNISNVKGEDLATVPVVNFQDALQGRMAGVFVQSSSGKLGEGVKIRVRGTTSISGGNDPLYVIDGVPITTGGALGYYNPMADINFNDIESLDVLKDASASAIYGARAANGVVLITTKTGAKGKTKFNVGVQRGVSSPTRTREFLNASEYVELMREGAYNNDLQIYGIDPINNPDEYEGSDLQFVEDRLTRFSGYADWRTGEIDTDWQKQAFNDDAGTLSVNFSASGGDDKTRFFLSAAYDQQTGILIRNDFERISARLNLDHSVSEKFLIGANFSLSRTNNNRLSDDNQFNNPIQLVALAPITPIRDQDGVLYDRPTTTYYNNLIDSENAEWVNVSYRNLTNLFGEYKLSSDLKFRTEFGIDVFNQNEERFFGSRTNTGQSTNGYGLSRWTRIVNYNTNNFFSYNKVFGGIHNLEAILGMSFQRSDQNNTFVEGQEFPLDDLKTLASAAEITGGSSSVTNFSFLSYFARVNYKYGPKYLATLSARMDGSSRFGPNNRYGFFPAASVGWILTEEGFLKGSSSLSLLKFRGSYGLTGNAEIGNFEHLGLYGSASYGLVPGLVPTQIPNPDLTWENTLQADIGIEFGFFSDRITGEIDYYNKNTSDLLLNVPVPATSGFTTQLTNIGKMQNQGVEIVLNSMNVAKPNFTWSTSFNLAKNVNKVKELAPGQSMIPPSSSRFLNAVIIGEPLGVFYGAAYAGVDQANGDALYYSNADRTETTSNYNEAERLVLGDPTPDFIAGLTNTIQFKGFELMFLFQGVFGNQIYDGGGGFFAANGDWFDNSTRDQMARWQKPGDVTDIPQARLGECNGCSASSRYLSDGSYIRFKTLNVGYSFDPKVLSRLKVTSLRVFFTGQNLLTFTDYKGWDPEVSADYLTGNIEIGNDFYSAPQSKTFSLGLNIGF
jgi:TonB-linked SusC/RagA family outer membrane protein